MLILAFSLLIVLAISTTFSIYSFQSQKQAMEILSDEDYVKKKIREELGSEFEFIILDRPVNIRENDDIRDWVKHHSSSVFVRVFIAYLKDPKTTDLAENEFYFGFIDTRGNVYTLPKNELLI
jgi:hypothetical protein